MSRTVLRLAKRVAAVILPAAALVAVAGGPAHARLVLTAPQMQLQIVEVRAVGFYVCAYGSATSPGSWALSITGARSNGTTVTGWAGEYGLRWDANNCLDVLEYGTLSGEFQATFTYTPSSGGRPSIAAGGGTWDLLTGEHSWDTA